MRDIKSIRRENLILLVEREGSFAKLNEKLGRKRNDATLNQIVNKAKDFRSGQPKAMGDKIARSLETMLSLGYGWMDADHSHDAFPEEDNLIYLHKINVSACCGNSGIENYDSDESYIDTLSVSRLWFKENVNQIRERGYEIITASGDSMEPTFNNGDLVIIDRFDTAVGKRDGVFCVVIDGDLYLKRIQSVPGALRFISDNKLYESFEIKKNELESRLVVVGRAVNSLSVKRF